jgi:hypothetical protein
MTRNLISRIGKLEALYAPPKLVRSPLVMLVEREQEGELARGERVVEDWFRDCGPIVWARERVTTETEDGGRRCPPGGYLLDVLETFHEHCPWRSSTGVCQMCEGTPVRKEECKEKTGIET